MIQTQNYQQEFGGELQLIHEDIPEASGITQLGPIHEDIPEASGIT
jgi:hypothetical protein